MKTKDQLLRENESLKKRIDELEIALSQKNHTSNTILTDSNQGKRRSNPLETSNLHENIIEVIQEGIWITDKNDVIFYANLAMEKIAGVPKKEIIGKNVLTDFLKEPTEKFKTFYLEAKESLKPVWYEVLVKNPVGKDTWQNGWLLPQIKKGECDGIICTASDITEKKLAEIEQEKLIQTLNSAQKMAKIGYWRYNIKTQQPWWSDMMFEVLGADKNKGVSFYKDHKKTWHPDDWEMFDNAVNECIKGKPYDIIVRVLSQKDGTYHYINTQGFPVKNERGQITELVGTSQDITDIKKNEVLLKKSEEKFRLLFEASNLPIGILNTKGELADVNEAACKFFEYSKEKLLNVQYLDLTHPDYKEISRKKFTEAQKNKKAYKIEKKYITGKGATKWGLLSFTPVFDKKGDQVFSLAQLIDISKSKAYQEEIQKSEERLRSFFHTNPSATFVWKKIEDDFFLNDVNEASQVITNGKAFDYIGMRASNIYKDLPFMIEKLNECWETKKVIEFEHYYENRNQDTYDWINFRLACTDPDMVLLYSEIITERKNAEKEMQKTQYYLSKAQELGNIGTWELDIQKNDLKWTDEVYKIFGLPLGTPIDYEIFLYCVHPEDRNFVNEEWLSKMMTNNYDIEHRIIAEKQVKWVREKAEVKYDEKGKPIRAIGFVQNITERKMAEFALKESEENFREMFNNMGNGVCRYNVVKNGNDFIFSDINKAGEKIAKIKKADVIGKSIFEVRPNTEEYGLTDVFKRVWKTGKSEVYDECFYQDEDLTGYFKNFVYRLNSGDIVAIFEDLTKDKQKEKKLKESESRFRNMFENHTAVMLLIEPDTGKIFKANQAAVKYYGYTLKEFNSLNVEDLNTLEPEEAKKKRKQAESRHENTFCLKHRLKNNTIRDVQVHSTPIYYFNQKLLFSIIIDITERNRAEAELIIAKEKAEKNQRELNQYLQHLQNLNNSLVDVVFTVNPENRKIKYVNKAIEMVFGYSQKESVGLNTSVFYSEEKNYIEFGKKLKEVLSKSKDYLKTEIPLKRKNGEIFNAEITTSFIKEHGKVVEILSIVRDISGKIKYQNELITARKQAEKSNEKLAETLSDLYLAQQIADVGNWQYNPAADCQFWSEIVYAIHEINPNEKPPTIDVYRNIFNPEQFEAFDKSIQSAIKDGKGYDIIYKLKLPSGKTKWVRTICKPDLNKKTEKGYYLRGTIQDITKLKNIQIELTNALEQAKKADHLKSVFLANMSHEIRTPMNGILSFASLLKNPEISKSETKKYVEVIEKSGARMLNTINDLIDISRIESGVVEVTKSNFKVNEQLEYLHIFFKPEAKKKNIDLVLHISKRGSEKEIYTDKEKWTAILINLLKNAIKYTNKGTIEFGYKLISGKFEFYVKDTGIGIAKSRFKAIFERFVQEDLTITKPYEGAGLGLAISRGLAKLLGGDIRVESEKGVGSTFYFSIDDTAIEEMKEDNLSSDNAAIQNQYFDKLKSLTILIAEDEEFSKMFFKEIFNNYCKALIFVESGKECIRQVKNNPEIDLILMDIKMNVLDGYSATKEIRKFNRKVKIIAQTAFALTGEREKALKAGCDEYISKPINQKQLFEMICTVCGI